MRERFDAGAGLMTVGAVLLLISLFIDWYDPGGDAWAVFELTDVLLAGLAGASLLALVPRYASIGRAQPMLAFVAFAVVAVQLIDLPPAARDTDRVTGAWLALGGATLMAVGAALAAASIAITVDVRERRRRTTAIDARDEAPAPRSTEPDPTTASPADDEAELAPPRSLFSRRREDDATTELGNDDPPSRPGPGDRPHDAP